MKKNKGFTLVELLIVISILGALTAVLLSTLNPSAQRHRASDGVKLANIEKIVTGIQAYEAGEGRYPLDLNSDGNPLNDNNGLSVYMAEWPNGTPQGSTYNYWTDGRAFGVVVVKSSDALGFKFRSDWSVTTINECENTSPSSEECKEIEAATCNLSECSDYCMENGGMGTHCEGTSCVCNECEIEQDCYGPCGGVNEGICSAGVCECWD